MASEDFATERQIKRLHAVLHSVGLDPTQWKKDQNIASYAKLTRAQCSGYIDEAEALEAEQKGTGTHQPGLPQQPNEKEQFGARAEAEAQRIREEQGRAAATPAPQPATPKPTLDELIMKYVEILARVTVAINNEDRISDREKGYGVNWVVGAVKDALEKGGDHEEQD